MLEGEKESLRVCKSFGCPFRRPELESSWNHAGRRKEKRGNSTRLLERDVDPYIHSSLHLRVTNGEVESCEEKRQSGKK